MNGDLVFLIFASLIPPVWLIVGLIGRAARTRHDSR